MENNSFIKNQEFVEEFVEEALGHVEEVEKGLILMDSGSFDEGTVNGVFRSLHSVKGTASFFGLRNIVELAHIMESLFGEFRNRKLQPTSAMLDELLSANDKLRTLIQNVEKSEKDDITAYKQRLSLWLQGNHGKGNIAENQLSERDSQGEIPALVKSLVGDELKTLIDSVVNHAPAAKGVTLNSPERKAEISESSFLSEEEETQLEYARKHGQKLYLVKENAGQSLLEILSSLGRIVKIITLKDGRAYWVTCVLAKDLFEAGLENLSAEVEQMDYDKVFVAVKKDEVEPSRIFLADSSAEGVAVYEKAEESLVKEDRLVDCKREKAGNGVLNPPIVGEEIFLDENASDASSSDEGATDEWELKAFYQESSIRVPVHVLNELLNITSEMVLGRNQLLRALADVRQEIDGLEGLLQHFDRTTLRLQEKVMQARVQPISVVFNKFPRLVREMGKKLGKEVKLQLDGMNVELDKSIVEVLGDPLTHLLRNALDHGIEPREVRERQGKASVGNVSVRAYHAGGQVYIDVTDDGAGIDGEKVRQQIIRRRLLPDKEIREIADQDLLKMLFLPGFSTADSVSDMSGRGVGLDVVKTNIEKLGGSLEVMTTVGRGSTFRLSLPLTLAIISALTVETLGQKFVMPQSKLQEIIRVRPEEAGKRLEYVNEKPVIRLRNMLLPLVFLADVLQTDGDREFYLSSEWKRPLRILVVRNGMDLYGLVVDAIQEQEDILVKPLPRFLTSCLAYSGVTILGDGNAALILDAEGIAEKAGLHFHHKETVDPTEVTQRTEFLQSILLFQCGGSELFGLDMGMVARVKKIDLLQKEMVGDQAYLKVDGVPVLLIQPERYLPVHREDKSTPAYLIMLKGMQHSVGILASRLYDYADVAVPAHQNAMGMKGVLMSLLWRERMVLMLDIYGLLQMALPDSFPGAFARTAELEQARVLVVTWNPYHRILVSRYLQSLGYQLSAAEDVAGAYMFIERQEIDLILCGEELYAEMERMMTQGSSDIPLLMLKGKGSHGMGDKAGKTESISVLDHHRILQQVEKLLAGRRRTG